MHGWSEQALPISPKTQVPIIIQIRIITMSEDAHFKWLLLSYITQTRSFITDVMLKKKKKKNHRKISFMRI